MILKPFFIVWLPSSTLAGSSRQAIEANHDNPTQATLHTLFDIVNFMKNCGETPGQVRHRRQGVWPKDQGFWQGKIRYGIYRGAAQRTACWSRMRRSAFSTGFTR